MTPRTPQYEVCWALLLNSKHSGVSEDSKSPTLGVLGFTPTLGQSGVATINVVEFREYDNLKGKLIIVVDDIHLLISTNLDVVSLEGKVQKFNFVATKEAYEETTTVEDEGEGEEEDGEKEVEKQEEG